MKLLGLPVDYMEKFTRHVRSVEPEQIRAAARKYIGPDRASIVVVGDASAIGRDLERIGGVSVVKAE